MSNENIGEGLVHSSFELNKNDMITLFGYYLALLPSRWSRAQNYFNFYVTLNVSLIAASIGGLSLFPEFPQNFVLILGPMLILISSTLAKKTIKRQDKHIKELIVMTSKFAFELGLFEKLNFHKPINGKYLWENDESFIFPKWAKHRMESGTKSSDFVNQFSSGSRKYGYHLFTTFQIFSIILIIVIGLMPLF